MRVSRSYGLARKREYDGRRFGSYAMFPLRGARAAGLVLEVKAHTVRSNVKSVDSSEAGNRGVTWRSSYLPVLEPVRWCLEDDIETSEVGQPSIKARPALKREGAAGRFSHQTASSTAACVCEASDARSPEAGEG